MSRELSSAPRSTRHFACRRHAEDSGLDYIAAKADSVPTDLARLIESLLLVPEDLIYEGPKVAQWSTLEALWKQFGELLPKQEQHTMNRLATRLLMIPDADFTVLMQRAISVRARWS